MMVVFYPAFVPNNLAVKLVNQLVDRRIQIGVGALSKHVGAFDPNIALGPLPSLFFFLIFNRQ